MRTHFRLPALASICLLFITKLSAQVSITSTAVPYTQNFNTLITSGTSSVLPAGWKLLETGTNANTTLAADAGATATGNTYSYGTGTATDRAFGGLLSGSLTPVIGVQITNNTGSTITSLTISYTGEEWRLGTAARADQLDFQYSLSATSLSTGTWTDFNALDFITPATTTTGAKDGNATANRTAKSSIITGLSISNGSTFWLRWNDFDASGADDGLAIDDFSIQLNGSDVTPPTATGFNPLNGATGLALSGNLVVTFSENIQKGTTGNISVKRTGDNVAVQTTAVTAAAVTVSGAAATIPFSGLAYNTGYYVTIDAGTFKDLAGNNFAGITTTTTWAFTTQAPPAATVTVNPASLAFGFIAAGSSSTTQTFSYTTTNITSSLTLTSPSGFTVSKDGLSFGTSVVYTQAEAAAGQTVSVRFSPPSANTTYSGLINFSSTGLNDNKVNLSGNSIVTGGGPLNFYFGNLHSHSSYSDGNADNTSLVPADDYAYAKTALCMDFLGISEHNHATAGMNIANWQPGRTQAVSATTSSFVGLYGMEWGVISGGGHVIVYGMDSLVGWEAGNYQVFVAKSVYRGAGGLFDILNRHGGNALAYLAHPNNTDYNDVLNSTFDIAADNAIVGSAVESGPAFSTNTTYTNPATSMSYLSYYKNMLAKGYHLGPTIDHDNHNLTHGHTAKSRLVIQAASLSENTLLDGMKKMRFYASEDCGAKINFTINTEYIGSIVTKAGAPTVTVSTLATASAISSVSIMSGVPGSGTAATLLTTNVSGNFTYTDNALANGSQAYYYLDITEADGSRIVTSPIWYTRNDAALRGVSSLTSFFTVNEADRVILKWTTENEEAEQWFEVQRSADGKNFEWLYSQDGKGMSASVQTYAFSDLYPLDGVSYYRLVQRNRNGDIRFTDVKVVNRKAAPASYYTIFPNPVQGLLNIKISSAANDRAVAEIIDLNGRQLINRSFEVTTGLQMQGIDMSKLSNGMYILKLTLNGKTRSQLINKF